MKNAIISFLRNKLFSKIYDAVLSHVKINYEKTIIVCLVIALASALTFTFLDLQGTDWDIAVIHLSSADAAPGETDPADAAVTETIQWRWGGFQIAACLSWFVFVFLIIVWGLLHVEKKNNRKAHFNERRRLDAWNAGFATELLSFVQGRNAIKKTPEDWRIPKSPKGRRIYLSRKAREMSSNILMQYNNICQVIGKYLERHICEKNREDIIHVSIKAFLDSENHRTKVVSFGLYNGNGHANGNSGGNVPASIMARLEEAYYIDADYAMQRITEASGQPAVFICSDIKKLIEYQKKPEASHDPAGKYRTPCSRQFNATIVVPIGIVHESSPDEFSVIGAVCVDTTNTYEDWKEHDSYEEQLMSFAAAIVAELLQHNIEEFKLLWDMMNEPEVEG